MPIVTDPNSDMALDASTTQRADKIAHRFFTKFALVVDNARIPDERRDTTKKDEWVRN